MARVTEYFGINSDVPFVDVHVDRDNDIYLDPSAIRNDQSPLGAAANNRLTTLFERVVAAARSNTPQEHAIGRELLRHLHEPNETRLGMSVGEPRGRAFGDKLAEEFWQELRVNPACQDAAIRRLEDTRLCLKFVGNDRISDMTTRIIFDVLAKFTTDMMTAYPALKAGAQTAESDVWVPDEGQWQGRTITLPFATNKQLLLVPQPWVSKWTLMYPDQFYNLYSTQAIQDEQTTFNEKGRRVKPSKEAIKKQNPDKKPLNSAKAAEYITAADGRDLIGEYRSKVDIEFEPLTAEAINERIGD
ncbi:hypothetical protein [Mycolicibacterium komossense]|uniref:Uncharacterized protein n=1 Tax=Mycolicibacterium komossense TaxID=1779 RepID=A0ABT3CMR1_9MYCO|nr:hypothetical protein [Mycolicibacterium komossense]MCV7230643.1 hypothetical protein [Mycolicibacterium komossense]